MASLLVLGTVPSPAQDEKPEDLPSRVELPERKPDEADRPSPAGEKAVEDALPVGDALPVPTEKPEQPPAADETTQDEEDKPAVDGEAETAPKVEDATLLPDGEDTTEPPTAAEEKAVEEALPEGGELPVPTRKPQPPEAGDEAADEAEDKTEDKPDTEAAAREDEAAEDAPMPREEVACRARLRELGVVFEEHEPLAEESGCAAPHPLSVSGLPDGVVLRPNAVLTCTMAEATARFVTDHANPLARRALDAEIAAIDQVSSYVCRPRNGTTKLSEHAFANALDWGGIELSDGTTIDVRAYSNSEPRRARLVKDIQEAACGPFKTVLGPGSDADHSDHFHFDMAQRRNGGTFCQ